MSWPGDSPTVRPRLQWLDEALADLERRELRRDPLVSFGRQGPTLIDASGRTLVNFGSNDYLGLAGDPRLAAAAIELVEHWGWGAGASPLVTGRSQPHAALEEALADFEGVAAALLFTTGYAANVGAITALVGPGDAVFSDALNHASIVDGCRLSRADIHIYPHADVANLQRQLADSASARRKLIVTDSLFSMDGDLAPLADLAELADRHGAMLLVDEAHATGVFGARGRGVAEHLGVEDGVDIRIGTLSKALGCHGGFVAGPRSLCQWLLNRARPYVFSTAAPIAACGPALAALQIVATEPQRRERVLTMADELRAALLSAGLDVGPSQSQIVPVLVGGPGRAVALAASLREQGLFVPAIRPPTVPVGQSRLRISLSAGHDNDMIERLVTALKNAGGNV